MRLLKLPEAAAKLGIHRNTLARWTDEGHIKAAKEIRHKCRTIRLYRESDLLPYEPESDMTGETELDLDALNG